METLTLLLFGVDLFDRADGVLHAAGLDPNVVARLKIDADGALAAGHSLIFLVRQRNRLASRADQNRSRRACCARRTTSPSS